MPNVMIRRNAKDELVFYVAKKDLEETIEQMEYTGPQQWGGKIHLGDGSNYYIEPLETEPKLPISVRAKRL